MKNARTLVRPVGGGHPRAGTLDRILRVATRRFAERGYGMTSMRDIAGAAGIQPATLYHYFRSKDDLYRQVLDREQAKLRDMMNEVLAEDSDFRTQMREMIARAFDHHQKNPSLAKLGLRAAMGDGLPRPYDPRWLDLMEALLRPRAARGEIKEVDPALFLVTASAIITQHAITGGTVRELVGNRLSREELDARTREHVQQMILRCLGLDETADERRR